MCANRENELNSPYSVLSLLALCSLIGGSNIKRLFPKILGVTVRSWINISKNFLKPASADMKIKCISMTNT